MQPNTLAMFGLPGGFEWIVIGLVGLLLFGRRMPDIARSMGKSIIEFKKGLRDVKDEMSLPAGDSTPSLPPDPKRATIDPGTPSSDAAAHISTDNTAQQESES